MDLTCDPTESVVKSYTYLYQDGIDLEILLKLQNVAFLVVIIIVLSLVFKFRTQRHRVQYLPSDSTI